MLGEQTGRYWRVRGPLRVPLRIGARLPRAVRRDPAWGSVGSLLLLRAPSRARLGSGGPLRPVVTLPRRSGSQLCPGPCGLQRLEIEPARVGRAPRALVHPQRRPGARAGRRLRRAPPSPRPGRRAITRWAYGIAEQSGPKVWRSRSARSVELDPGWRAAMGL